MEWIKVGNEKSLKDGVLGFDCYDKNDNNNKKKLLIAKIHGKIYPSNRICTHEYAELFNGFLNEEERTVTCPLHLSVFNLESGIPLNPPAEKPLKTYEVKIKEDDGGVYVYC